MFIYYSNKVCLNFDDGYFYCLYYYYCEKIVFNHIHFYYIYEKMMDDLMNCKDLYVAMYKYCSDDDYYDCY